MEIVAVGLLWYVVFLFSTVCHEAAHSLVAKWGGDLTASQGGQVTLNPLPHIRREPWGMVIIPFLTYFISHWMMGWASAPYNPAWSYNHPRRAAKMALAGPAANFLLAAAAVLCIHAGLLTGVFTPPESPAFSQVVDAVSPGAAEGAAKFLSLLFSLNVLLGTFNLVPLPPLDGFNALCIFLNDNGGRRFLEFGNSIRRYSLIGLFLSWRIFGSIYQDIFSLALRTLYPTFGAL